MARTRKLWADTVIDMTLATSTVDFIDLTSTFLENEMRLAQLTLLRTIIGIDIAYSVHDAGEGSQQVSCGIGVVNREALVAGVASLPQPQVAADFPTRPWVWRARYRIFGFAADQPAVFNQRVDLDLRSMRKLENGENVFIAANNPEEGVTTTILVSGMIRSLYAVT